MTTFSEAWTSHWEGRAVGSSHTCSPDLCWQAIAAIVKDSDDEYCRRCLGPNAVWYAPDDVWNAVMRSGVHKEEIVCPPCFAEMAEHVGIGKRGAWEFSPSDPPPEVYEQGPWDGWGDSGPGVNR